MKRRLIAGLLVMSLGLSGCGSDEAVEAVVTTAVTTPTTVVAETTTTQTTTPDTTNVTTKTTVTELLFPETLLNIDDIYLDAAYRNKKYNPTSHAFIEINSDGFDDVLVYVNNETEGLFYCYTYNGTRYRYIGSCVIPSESYKYEPNIFDNTQTSKSAQLLDEIRILDFEYNGKTIKTIPLMQISKYSKLNYIYEITLDENKKPSLQPIIAWGLGTHFSADGNTMYATYRSKYGSYLNDFNDISAKRFHELTDEYFEKNKDYMTFIPPEYDAHEIIQNSVSTDDLLYFYDDYDTVYLIREGKIIDTFSGWITKDYFYTSEYYKNDTVDFDIPPHFEYQHRMFNVFNDRISEVKFIVDGKDIYDLGDPPEFLQYVLKTGDRSFIVYIYDLYDYSIGINGKVEFTYNPENNCFEGEYIDKISPEAEQIVKDLFIAADTLEDKVTLYYYVETEYSLSYEGKLYGDPDKIVKFDDCDYSKIVEEGFRTRDELIATLNTLYTPEYSEEIYKRWTDNFDYAPSIIEKDNELYLYIPGGLGDNEWGEPCFDIISADEDTIEARVVMLDYRSGGAPYFNVIYPKNIIIIMTPNGYRISQIPFM